MTILKIIFVFVLAFILTPFSSAYKAEDYKSFYVDSQNNNYDLLYTIPEGYDFILNYIYADHTWSNYIDFKDWGVEIGLWDIKEHKNEIFLAFKEDIEIRNNWNSNHYTITGFLVWEDEDIQGYIEKNSTAWNKHIFNKEDIDFIYFREFILMFFLVVLRFLSIISNRKIDIF